MRSFILLFLLGVSGSLPAQELWRMGDGRTSAVSSFENLNGKKASGGMTNHSAKGNAFESVKAGENKSLLNIQGAGIIQRIWITVGDRSPAMLRSLRLRMYWDGASKAAVDVPLGDFFCAGLGEPTAFQSALFSNPEGRSFNCFIPMPFKTGARVMITNESNDVMPLLFFDIDFVTGVKLPEKMLYFHACWTREESGILGEDMVVLPKVNGSGRFLGTSIGVITDSAYLDTWWGEGEVKMYIDGDGALPSINGTGAEDYIGTGWGEGTFANQYEGCLAANEKNRGFSFYRFHIPDEIFFYHNFNAVIQKMGGGPIATVISLQKKGVPLKPVTISCDSVFVRLLDQKTDLEAFAKSCPAGWMNFYRLDDYAATAYFYLDKPVSNLGELAPVATRTRNLR